MMASDKIHALGLFAARDGRSIKTIAILDGFVYATDGCIAIKMKLGDLRRNEVPNNYPINKLKSILNDADECNATNVIEAKQKAVELCRRGEKASIYRCEVKDWEYYS